VVAPERIRVNCDLRHVDVVLCCDPKAFTHSNPLAGMAPGGTFVWESDEDPATAWERIPPGLRQEVIDKQIRIFVLPGFDIARRATSREDLQMRMQGNAFLGAFFRVSSLLKDNGVTEERFHEVVRAQYVKKFGRFGDAVVDSNMTVMTEGFGRVLEVPCGDLHAADRSSMLALPLAPRAGGANGACGRSCTPPAGQAPRIPITQLETFDREFRAGLDYHQPASPLASVSVIATATGATASKYVARRETPLWIAENCTQCMECISACPDTALPNTAQDIGTILRTACASYLTSADDRKAALAAAPDLEANLRSKMLANVKAKETDRAFKDLVQAELKSVAGLSENGQAELAEVFERIPFAYGKTAQIFNALEKKNPGEGGLFAIFVSDLCKGCGECVVECGEHEALVMAAETEELNADHFSGTNFMNLLPDTPQKYLGRFNNEDPLASHLGALRNHLMVRSHYEALVSGDGACAGCGEKTVLHVLASLTEAYMRPLYHARAERLEQKAAELESRGEELLAAFSAEQRALFTKAVAHTIMGLGGDSAQDTEQRLAAHGEFSPADIIGAICSVLRADAFRHRDLQAIDGRLANGMSVMAMGAHTGCNTVYGSTPPNIPHTYPWMNSLFQDGVTVSWLFGESFIIDHARHSVVPERLCDALLDGSGVTDSAYYDLTHMTDTLMTDLEIAELPKAWAIGGDGGMGDIGYQNVSKVIMQNRPNVKVLMLDTQVYSNTGGQNSDSTPMPGGNDMNAFGEFTQGKLTEKKNVAETFISGHGSPFIAQVSMANSAKLMRSLLDALAYRGGAFIQAFTTCQPEHGVGDAQAVVQASRARDSRSMPEFVFDPSQGESYGDTLLLKGNPAPERDWGEVRSKARGGRYRYTVAHYAATEARFRRHLVPLKGDAADYIALEDKLLAITQSDVTGRRFLNETHRSFVPDYACWLEIDDESGGTRQVLLSRQLVLFCVERRRAWRMLQSKAGLSNPDYLAQRAALKRWDEDQPAGACDHRALRTIFDEELAALLPAKKTAAAV
jgi:pyruvate-ferredoxin/flavodoxin oxidoreductase